MALTPSLGFDVDPATIDEIQGDGSQYYLVALEVGDEASGPDGLTATIVATWQIVGRPGTFTVARPVGWDWADRITIAIAIEYARIQAIYGIAV